MADRFVRPPPLPCVVAQINVLPIRMFIEGMTRWADCVESGDCQGAKHRAEHITKAADLLTIDPEFKRIFLENKQLCDSHDPKAAMECLSAFLHAVADAISPGRYRPPDAPRAQP